MPDAATGLQVTNMVQGTPDWSINFSWTLPVTENQADMQWLDVATDAGFINYVFQKNVGIGVTSYSVNLPPGFYWARVNTHYPGYGQFPLDRGWFPSEHILVTVDSPPPPVGGIASTNLMWDNSTKTLSWSQGIGTITRVSVDLSTFPNFSDILASPFVAPSGCPACSVTIDGFPFAIDMPISISHVVINGIPLGTAFYVRVNTLFNNAVWVPSDTVKFNANGTVSIPPSGGGFPWLILGLVGALAALAVYRREQEQE